MMRPVFVKRTAQVGKHLIWKFSIPSELAMRLDYLLMEPSYDLPMHTVRSRLICELLGNWAAQQEAIRVNAAGDGVANGEKINSSD